MSSAAHTDSGLAPATGYLYRVRAVGSSGTSGFSATDAAATIVFADAFVSPGTPIRAVHLAELRAGVDAMRAIAELPPLTLTSVPGAGMVIRASHFEELRSGLDEARDALGLHPLVWTPPAITGGATAVGASHIVELRDGVQ